MNYIDVCAAVIRRGNMFLLARRLPNSHLAGKWEFPGGKMQDREKPNQCIEREILEELGVVVTAGSLIATIEHQYPDKAVRLRFIECDLEPDAQPISREGQQFDWFALPDITALDLASADRKVLETLKVV